MKTSNAKVGMKVTAKNCDIIYTISAIKNNKAELTYISGNEKVSGGTMEFCYLNPYYKNYGFRVYDNVLEKYCHCPDSDYYHNGRWMMDCGGDLINVTVTEGGADFDDFSNDERYTVELYSTYRRDDIVFCEGDVVRFDDNKELEQIVIIGGEFKLVTRSGATSGTVKEYLSNIKLVCTIHNEQWTKED